MPLSSYASRGHGLLGSRIRPMNEELQQIFDNAPGDEPKSRLEPYRELVLRWRRQGRSYRRICQLLRDKCGVDITYLPLYEFVQRRSRPRKPRPEPEVEQPQIPASEPEPVVRQGKETDCRRTRSPSRIYSLSQSAHVRGTAEARLGLRRGQTADYSKTLRSILKWLQQTQ